MRVHLSCANWDAYGKEQERFSNRQGEGGAEGTSAVKGELGDSLEGSRIHLLALQHPENGWGLVPLAVRALPSCLGEFTSLLSLIG